MTSDLFTGDAAQSVSRPDSPCVGKCSTTYGDDVCRGCGRTYIEVIEWITYDAQRKAEIWARLQAGSTQPR